MSHQSGGKIALYETAGVFFPFWRIRLKKRMLIISLYFASLYSDNLIIRFMFVLCCGLVEICAIAGKTPQNHSYCGYSVRRMIYPKVQKYCKLKVSISINKNSVWKSYVWLLARCFATVDQAPAKKYRKSRLR